MLETFLKQAVKVFLELSRGTLSELIVDKYLVLTYGNLILSMDNPDEIIRKFEAEFNFIKHKFRIIDLKLSEVKSSMEEFVYHPGVYIFYNSTSVIKVGRHLVNCRKRALEHVRDNTRNEHLEMRELVSDSASRILLINSKKVEDRHWVAAVELFMETHLSPVIKSKRLG
ncbi:hypothetical protein [uncultured Algoriphagus sp.]|uniref:hypothetical protein n=1 Tax=uncultured Algoriphagus sp. TaxID=417365 RepID=UPI0030EC9202|tara:strand:+ start:16501 stop:17010 length:510 start_codon:yes stop_codon:yes gene_type:complete